jgi:hypothetical protein
MKQLKTTVFVSFIGLVVLGIGLLAASQASAASGTIRAGSDSVAIGTETAIDIDALNMTAPGLGAWSINVVYDPTIVTPVECSGATQACNLAFDDTTIRLAGANGGGLEGDNTLATLTFQCDAEGTSPLTLTFDTVADATPAHPADIDVTGVDGSIECAAQVAGEGTVIKIGSASAAIGGRAAVELQSLNVPEPGLGAWTIDVAYDPDVVHTVSCTAGSTGLSVCNPDFSGNTFRVTGANIDGLPGDNTLADVTFECDKVDSSPLHITVQVLADATVGQPQTIVPTTTDGTISCTTLVVAPTPTKTPPPVLPPAGSGGGIGFDAGNPLSWIIAGLIGAGLAWLASGIASAGFATVTNSGPAKPAARPPVAPERPQEQRSSRGSLPRSMPTWRRRDGDLGSPPDQVEPDWFGRSK